MKKLLTSGIIILTCSILAACGGNGEEKPDTTLAHDASDCTTAVTTEADTTEEDTTEADTTEDETTITDTTAEDTPVETETVTETLDNFDTKITVLNKKTGEPILITVYSGDGVYKYEYYYGEVHGKQLVVTELTYLCASEFIAKEHLAHEINYEYNEQHKKIKSYVKAYLSSGTVFVEGTTEYYENEKVKTVESIYAFPDKNVKREVEEYDENGKLVKTTKYDENGNIIE